MANCEFSVLKSELSEQMIDEELKNYKKISDNIAEKIELVKDQIVSAKEQLVSAKEIRRNKLEYSSMARLIKEEPDRKEIIQKHETLKEALQKQNEQFQKVNRVLENRRKDFASFMLLTQELLKDINVPTETGSNELDIDDGTLDDDDIEKMMID
jgi:THO complex subunit 7